jgi:1,4-dihydroxy-2-naphthoate octaprenyltransferase
MLYRSLIGISYGVPVYMLPGAGTGLSVLLPFLTAPMAWSLCTAIGTITGSELNDLLARTAKLSLFFCLLFSLGIAL